MNPFRQITQDLAINKESQGTGNEFSWLYVLLSTMGDSEAANPVEPTFPTNPVKEMLHRLQSYSDTFAVQRIGQILNKLTDKYPA